MRIPKICCIFALRNNLCATKIVKIFEVAIKLKKTSNMEFKDYVNSLPNEREQTIMDLAKICRVSNSTVYRWLRGDFMPDPLKRKVIADYLRKSEKELFPNV